MKAKINGAPAFAYIDVDLDPGETIIAESDAMASMSSELELVAKLNGGFLPAVSKKLLGGESLFVNHFKNPTNASKRLTLVQKTPGDIRQVELSGRSLCLQPGAYIASTPGLDLGLRYAGISSFIGREGLFKLEVSGSGTLWYGAYGGLVDRQIRGEYIVDSSHLVAYEPQLKLRTQLAGGIFGSFFGGEGLVTRIEGEGMIVMQTRSLTGFASWLNPKIY